MENNKNYEEMFGQFIGYYQQLHVGNQKKIRVGLKVNILLPLVFLIISFLSEGSKLVFLILWIVSLFGIAFYLLYVEYTDFEIQEKLKEMGALDEYHEQNVLIGSEVVNRLDELQDFAEFEMFDDIKELKAGIAEDLKGIKTLKPKPETVKDTELAVEDLNRDKDLEDDEEDE